MTWQITRLYNALHLCEPRRTIGIAVRAKAPRLARKL